MLYPCVVTRRSFVLLECATACSSLRTAFRAESAGAPAEAAAQASSAEAAEVAELPPLGAADQRWRAEPVRLAEWRGWFSQQLSFSAKAKPENGLFVGLRLDGRVRSSGSGAPPWGRYALELAPLEGEGEWGD
ncbi:hypothetical protein Agub_g4310 [Astrephomene gubernaculifera]|uniref:Uncharacterized protein n=1 Tax=Astrephomene gubernaculifera TaxID=47775 RepID=A0AAD3HJ47_9CHLO|nr:hypothetical protein Agub_g4310 [Astrephomene gubernaculifera]